MGVVHHAENDEDRKEDTRDVLIMGPEYKIGVVVKENLVVTGQFLMIYWMSS